MYFVVEGGQIIRGSIVFLNSLVIRFVFDNSGEEVVCDCWVVVVVFDVRFREEVVFQVGYDLWIIVCVIILDFVVVEVNGFYVFIVSIEIVGFSVVVVEVVIVIIVCVI